MISRRFAAYGNFIQTAIDFALIGSVIFMLVRAYEMVKARG